MSEFVCEVAPDEFGELTEVTNLCEEIVRCRDCKHFDDGLCWLRKKCGYVIVEPNGYCAWGEKRCDG